MITAEKRVVSSEAYLVMERQALEKSEFFNGELIPVAGATRNHNRIRDNVNGKILQHLEHAVCQSFSSYMRVHLPETGLFAYPDIVIVCDEPKLLPDEFNNLLNISVLLEVISDSTEDYDRGRKFLRYRSIASFQEYILVDSQRMAVEVWRKNDLGQWTLVEQTIDPAGQFSSQTIGLTISLPDTYARTTALV